MAAGIEHSNTAFEFGYQGPLNISWDERALTYKSDDPRAAAASLFELRSTNGYMPTHMPVAELPDVFEPLESLLQDVPAKKRAKAPRPGESLFSEEKGLLYVGDRVAPPPGSELEAELREIRRAESRLRKAVEGEITKAEGDMDAVDRQELEARMAELSAVHDRKRAIFHSLIPEDKAAFDARYVGDGVDADLPLYGAVAGLPNLVEEVRSIVDHATRRDSPLIMALYRDYSFLLSVYVFEPCHHFYQMMYNLPQIMGLRTENAYGKARAVVPACIAQPLKVVADALGNLPFMEYQQVWGLNNWKFVHDTLESTEVPHFLFADGSLNYGALVDAGMFEYDNLDILRPCVGTEDERGFAVIHIQLEALTHKLILAARMIIDSAEAMATRVGTPDGPSRNSVLDQLRSGLHMHADTFRRICEIQHEMWTRSAPSGYLNLRTFIYGVEGNTGENKMFPPAGLGYEFEDGVTYLKPRGESGANSSIVPGADTLFGVCYAYPKNQLTKYLSELRSYRPLLQRDYLRLLGDAVTRFDIVDITPGETADGKDAMEVGGILASDPVTKFLWLLNVSQIRSFRLRHWRQVKAYIHANSRAPVATGGTPITSWLPNQLGATLQLMQAIINSFSEADVEAINEHFAPELHLLSTYFESRPQLPEDVHAAIESAESAYDMLTAAFTGTVAFCLSELEEDAEALRNVFGDQSE